jgi:hypothetical protein
MAIGKDEFCQQLLVIPLKDIEGTETELEGAVSLQRKKLGDER